MMFLTHLLFGILSGYFASGFLGFGNILLFVAVAAVASLLPDIDHVSSWLGRKLSPFSAVINFLFHHRGFMHSIWVPLLLYFIMGRISSLIAAALLVGYVSHILLDAATTKGIRPFHPLPIKLKGVIRTNGFIEKIILLLLIVLSVAVFLIKSFAVFPA